MSRINFNKDSVSIDILNRILSSTGLDSVSRSSKIRLISDILIEELSNMAEAYNTSMDGLYAETAIDHDLDLKGAQYGLHRKIRNSLYVDKADYVLAIEPQIEDQVFGDTVPEYSIIRRGESLDVGTAFSIVVAEDITINPQDSSVAISGTIKSIGEVGFSAHTNDVYKINTLSTSIGISTNTLQIRVLKPVALDGQRETDSNFRERILLARAGDRFNSIAVLRNIISQIPDISGSSLIIGKRGSGTMDIGFTTVTLQKNSADENMYSLERLLLSEVLSGSALGVDPEVFTPEPIDLHIEYTSPEDEYMDRNIKDSILEIFLDVYKYSESNTVSGSDIEDGIEIILKSTGTLITSMSLIDRNIGVSIYNGTNMAIAPQRHFMYLDIENITRG